MSKCIVCIQKGYLGKTKKTYSRYRYCSGWSMCSCRRDVQHAQGRSVHREGRCHHYCVGKMTEFTQKLMSNIIIITRHRSGSGVAKLPAGRVCH